jgi:hypothetical protein
MIFLFLGVTSMTDIQQLFTSKEASRFLRISPITLWRERKAGKISFRRVSSKVIYLRKDLDDYLEVNKREAVLLRPKQK